MRKLYIPQIICTVAVFIACLPHLLTGWPEESWLALCALIATILAGFGCYFGRNFLKSDGDTISYAAGIAFVGACIGYLYLNWTVLAAFVGAVLLVAVTCACIVCSWREKAALWPICVSTYAECAAAALVVAFAT